MSRECGSFDSRPIMKELQAIRNEQNEQRQAIQLLGKLLLENGGKSNDNGYQEASFGGLANAASKIGQILAIVAKVLAAVEAIKTLVETFTGTKANAPGVPEDIKLLRMIKEDTAKIGARTNSIQAEVDKIEKKVNDMLFVVNRTRPEIAKILPLEKKVNDSLFVLNAIRPELKQLDPIARKVNDSLYVLNTVRPEIQTTAKKANDAAYAATQASSKIGAIQGDITKLSLAVAAGFIAVPKAILAAIAADALVNKAAMTAQTTAILAAIAADAVASKAALAAQTATILAAIAASSAKDLLRGILESFITSAIDQALSRFFDRNDLGGGGEFDDRAILASIDRNTNRVIGQMSANQDELIKFIIGVRGTITGEVIKARDLLYNEFFRRLNFLERDIKKAIEDGNKSILIELEKQLSNLNKAISKALEGINKTLTTINNGVLKVYAILGGTVWGAIDKETKTETQPEAGIKSAGNTVFAANASGKVRANNLIDLLYAALTPQYYRTGLHRLPTQLPTKIHLKNGEQEVKQSIDTLVDFQFWQFKQLDSALGMYPISIKYKDAQNQEKRIELANIAEAITELVGLSLSMDSDTDIITELEIKAIGEAVQNKAQLSLAIDYLKAISDFLGFKSDIGGKSMPIPINPKKNSIKGFLEKSEQQIQTLTLKEPEDNDMISKLNQLLITTGMLRAVFTKRAEAGKVDGDKIKEDLDQRDVDWDKFVTFVNDIPTSLKDRGEPKPRVRDKSSLIQSQTTTNNP